MHTLPPACPLSSPLVQTAGLTASDKCSWICCCPSLWSSGLLPEAPLSSARHPARTKHGKAKLCMDGPARGTRRKHNTGWMCHVHKSTSCIHGRGHLAFYTQPFFHRHHCHAQSEFFIRRQQVNYLMMHLQRLLSMCPSVGAAAGIRSFCDANLS